MRLYPPSGWGVGRLHRRAAASINLPDGPRGRQTVPRCGFRLLAALGIWLAAGGAFAAEAGPSREETLTLQKRLTDAGCYQGAIDGAPSAALDAAVKACQDQTPVLRIEAGMHTAPIRRIGVDAACARIATASDDKTVRLWSRPDGKSQRTIRLPIGPGNGGKVYAAALSPDGRRLAAGGWDTHEPDALNQIDLDSGSIRRVGSLPDVIHSIAFSADGARVAVGANGIRVYDWSSGSELLADQDYTDDVYGLAFAPDGSLIASSRDGQLRRYGRDLRLTTKLGGLAGKQPYDVAVDPAGRRLAVGFYDESKVSILDAVTPAPIADADVSGVTHNLDIVAWSRDGGTLAAAGQAQAQWNGEWRFFLRTFDSNGRRRGSDIPVSDHSVFDLSPCGDGFAFAAADPAFGLASLGGASGSAHCRHAGRTREGAAGFRRRPRAGHDSAWTNDTTGVGPVRSRGGLARRLPPTPAGLAPARVDGLPVTDWKDNYEPKFKGVKIGLKNGLQFSRALAVRPDRSGFALGTEWQIRSFAATGKPLWKQHVPGHRLGRRDLQRGRPSPRRRLRRRHDSLATLVGRGRSCSRCSSMRSHAQMGRLDADRLLYGLGRRRGSDRLASQPRLDARGRLLPRLAFLRSFQPARYLSWC